MPDKQLPLEMLELELHGIDVELSVYRFQHAATTKAIEGLEAERANVANRINRLRYPSLTSRD